MNTAMLTSKNIKLSLTYRLRGLVHYYHGRKHDSTQKELRVLDLDWKAARRKKDTGTGLNF